MLFALERRRTWGTRIYSIHWIEPLLFGGVDLRIVNGREGKTPRIRTEHFDEPNAARTRARRLLMRRRAHGYRVITWEASAYETALLRVHPWSGAT